MGRLSIVAIEPAAHEKSTLEHEIAQPANPHKSLVWTSSMQSRAEYSASKLLLTFSAADFQRQD